MKIELFQPTVEGEARILLLIEAFSRGHAVLEGRTKLAKLDFFLRYPSFLYRALRLRGVRSTQVVYAEKSEDVETKMVRYRYGPWDPSYYATLGRLLGKGLIEVVPITRGIGYRVTTKGKRIATSLRKEAIWQETANRLDLLQKYLNLKGAALKTFIYDHFPEVTQASWGDKL